MADKCHNRGMQDCFRQYPEIYGEEMDDGDDEGNVAGEAVDGASAQALAAGPEKAVEEARKPVSES